MGRWTEEDIPSRVEKPGMGMRPGMAQVCWACVALLAAGLVVLGLVGSTSLEPAPDLTGVPPEPRVFASVTEEYETYEKEQMERQRGALLQMKQAAGMPGRAAQPHAAATPAAR
jgi:hypothetical protein